MGSGLAVWSLGSGVGMRTARTVHQLQPMALCLVRKRLRKPTTYSVWLTQVATNGSSKKKKFLVGGGGLTVAISFLWGSTRLLRLLEGDRKL